MDFVWVYPSRSHFFISTVLRFFRLHVSYVRLVMIVLNPRISSWSESAMFNQSCACLSVAFVKEIAYPELSFLCVLPCFFGSYNLKVC